MRQELEEEIKKCSAMQYKSFFDTVQVDLSEMKDLRDLISDED